MKPLLVSVLAALTLALPLPASALLCVNCSCTVTTTPVNFGAYAPLSGLNRDATGNVAMRCTTLAGLLIDYSIDLGMGSDSTSFSPRKMASGSNRLNYNLYTSGAYTSIWGDGNSGTSHVTGSATLKLLSATTVNHTVYGRIPANQKTLPVGSYSDPVVVTITYN